MPTTARIYEISVLIPLFRKQLLSGYLVNSCHNVLQVLAYDYTVKLCMVFTLYGIKLRQYVKINT